MNISCGIGSSKLATLPIIRKSLSTLSQKSQKTVAVVSPFSATVALFCDSVDRA